MRDHPRPSSATTGHMAAQFQPAPGSPGDTEEATMAARPRKLTRHLKTLSYRYTPGSLGTGTSLDRGAVMTEEYRLTSSRDRRLAELRADPRVQWAKAGHEL